LYPENSQNLFRIIVFVVKPRQSLKVINKTHPEWKQSNATFCFVIFAVFIRRKNKLKKISNKFKLTLK